MARTISWLPRLHEIRRSVLQSPRSVYTREELEALFLIQQTQATRLMAALPTTRLGNAYVVERDALVSFLARATEAPDVTQLMRTMKGEKTGLTRRKLRSYVRRDWNEVTIESLPANLKLSPGHAEIKFRTIDELVSTLFCFAQVINDRLDEFAARFEIREERPKDEAAEEVRRLFESLNLHC